MNVLIRTHLDNLPSLNKIRGGGVCNKASSIRADLMNYIKYSIHSYSYLLDAISKSIDITNPIIIKDSFISKGLNEKEACVNNNSALVGMILSYHGSEVFRRDGLPFWEAHTQTLEKTNSNRNLDYYGVDYNEPNPFVFDVNAQSRLNDLLMRFSDTESAVPDGPYSVLLTNRSDQCSQYECINGGFMMELLPILSIANHYVTDNLFIHGGNEDLRSAGCILMFSHKGSDINDIEASNVFNSLRTQPRSHVRKNSVAISGYTNGVGSQNQSTIDINNLAFQQSKYLHVITI